MCTLYKVYIICVYDLLFIFYVVVVRFLIFLAVEIYNNSFPVITLLFPLMFIYSYPSFLESLS